MARFLGILLSETAAESLTSALQPAREALPQLHWIDREGWHVTLYYMGDEATGKDDEISRAVTAITSGQKYLNLYFDRLKIFENPEESVLVVLLRKSQALSNLAHLLRTSLDSVLGTTKRQPFTPHVTVARDVTGLSPLVLPPFETEKRFEVVALELIETIEGAHGNRYRIVKEFPLVSDKRQED